MRDYSFIAKCLVVCSVLTVPYLMLTGDYSFLQAVYYAGFSILTSVLCYLITKVESEKISIYFGR